MREPFPSHRILRLASIWRLVDEAVASAGYLCAPHHNTGASVVLAALATGSFGGVDTATLALGITPARANEFNTRKRVRGRGGHGPLYATAQRHKAA